MTIQEIDEEDRSDDDDNDDDGALEIFEANEKKKFMNTQRMPSSKSKGSFFKGKDLELTLPEDDQKRFGKSKQINFQEKEETKESSEVLNDQDYDESLF